MELVALRTGGVISNNSVSIGKECLIANSRVSVTDDTGIRQTLDTLSHLEPAILLTSSTCSLSYGKSRIIWSSISFTELFIAIILPTQ